MKLIVLFAGVAIVAAASVAMPANAESVSGSSVPAGQNPPHRPPPAANAMAASHVDKAKGKIEDRHSTGAAQAKVAGNPIPGVVVKGGKGIGSAGVK